MRLRQRLEVSAAGLILSFQAISFNTQIYCVCVCAKSLQSCPALCNPMDCSPPGSSVHGILRQEYWSGLPCPPPGDLPDPEIKLMCLAPLALQADSLPPAHQGCTK